MSASSPAPPAQPAFHPRVRFSACPPGCAMELARPISPGTSRQAAYALLISVANFVIRLRNPAGLARARSRARARVMRSAHDAELERQRDRLRAAPRAELHENPLQMPVHRALADAQRSGDLFRGFPQRDMSQDLDFSPRKRWTHGLLLRRHRKN